MHVEGYCEEYAKRSFQRMALTSYGDEIPFDWSPGPSLSNWNYHLNVMVRDLPESTKFYGRLFGMEEAFDEMPRTIFRRRDSDATELQTT